MSSPHDPTRRRILKTLGAGAAAAAAAPVGASLLTPLGISPVREGEGFLDVGAAEELEPGKPVRVGLRADRTDAWVVYRNVELGSAWLLKGEDGSVTAFSAACPHLGCSVDFAPQRDRFECPCHDGVFARQGTKVSGPSPRDLDKLVCKVEGGRILLKLSRTA